MIEFTKAFVSNGKTFATLKEAQRSEIESILGVQPPDGSVISNAVHAVLDRVMTNSNAVTEALSIRQIGRPRKAAKVKRAGKTTRLPDTLPEAAVNDIDA